MYNYITTYTKERFYNKSILYRKVVYLMPENQKGVCECFINKRQSKNGNEYKVLCVEFTNGYTLETFLNNEQAFIVGAIIPTFE